MLRPCAQFSTGKPITARAVASFGIVQDCGGRQLHAAASEGLPGQCSIVKQTIGPWAGGPSVITESGAELLTPQSPSLEQPFAKLS